MTWHQNKARAIAGIGIDIEDISRFRKKSFAKNKTFYKRVFTEKEIEYCLGKASPCRHFAARFCAKEAFVKAMNKKIRNCRAIEVVQEKGKPCIKWGKARALLSLAHDKDKAIAMVVVEK